MGLFVGRLLFMSGSGGAELAGQDLVRLWRLLAALAGAGSAPGARSSKALAGQDLYAWCALDLARS